MSGGILFRGRVVSVAGVDVMPPASHGGEPWAQLDGRDYMLREAGDWVRMVVAHTTKGIAAQRVIPGRGPGGRARAVADFWRGDPEHSAAQVVVDTDGLIVCLCDVARVSAYHATVSNRMSVGVELYQEASGGIWEATLAAGVAVMRALCRLFDVAFQIPGRPYAGRPLRRMLDGGRDVVGVVGHRDNTDRRGSGDPGDELFRRLALAGAERFDLDAREDLAAWRARQDALNRLHGAELGVDGVAGPRTMQALRAAGYASGRDVPTVRPVAEGPGDV